MGGGVFYLSRVWVRGSITRWVCTRCHPYLSLLAVGDGVMLAEDFFNIF
jgi:hypothetical protein